ncbi:hypothetical protein OAL92_02510, partial [bacterium]|nr:hypothetical protein [bacterium]
MNMPRLIISIIVLAVFFAVYDILVHQIMLGKLYVATGDSWRTEDEMMSRIWILYVCYIPISIG